MKHYFVNKFYSKHTQKGMVFLYTIMLVLIIAVLTIAFLHMQFQEVFLIAHETDSLQAFYLAQSGLNQGIRDLSENLDLRLEQIRDDPDILCNQNYTDRLTTVYLDPTDPTSNKRGSYYFQICLDDTQADDVIIINGIGMINNNSNIRRIIQSRYIPPEGLPDKEAEDVARAVDGTTSLRLPNNQDVPLFGCDLESKKIQTRERSVFRQSSSGYQQQKPLDPNQIQAIDDFIRISRRKITTALRIDKNNNELLFFRNDIIAQKYDSPYTEGIDSSKLGANWRYPEFDYREYRKTQGSGSKRLTIILPYMTLNRNQQITLKEGLYFFRALTLEEDSTLTTDGYVQIFANRLELRDGARLIGENKNPNRLLILVEYSELSPYISDIERITIGASAEVYGHIFAPRLELYISAGRGVSRTRVQGFVLTDRLVAFRAPGTFGQVIICHDLNIFDEFDELPGSWQEVWNL